MTKPAHHKRDAPELLADLVDRCVAICHAKGVDANTADAIALALEEEMSACWGGQVIYFPKGARMRVAERHLQIYREFTGHNHAELAQRYDISMHWVYAIIKRVGGEIRAKKQLDMFDQ